MCEPKYEVRDGKLGFQTWAAGLQAKSQARPKLSEPGGKGRAHTHAHSDAGACPYVRSLAPGAVAVGLNLSVQNLLSFTINFLRT